MSPLAVPAADLQTLVPFWTEVFGVPAEVFTGVWRAVPPSRRRTFLSTEGEAILATVQVYVLPLNGANVGCIANVATRKSARRQGLSTELLERAIGWMDEEGVSRSYLFTGTPHHYARLGWQPTEERIREIENHIDPLAPDWTDPDFDRMARTYSEALPPFALRRDAAWWHHVVAPRLGKRLVWTTDDAYLVASRDRALHIEEAIGDEATLRRLVLGATAWAGGRSTLHGDLNLGIPGTRPGGMLRGGPMPSAAWFSALDHF